jgi:hypothetical protein
LNLGFLNPKSKIRIPQSGIFSIRIPKSAIRNQLPRNGSTELAEVPYPATRNAQPNTFQPISINPQFAIRNLQSAIDRPASRNPL